MNHRFGIALLLMVAFVTGFVSQAAANVLLPAFTEYNKRVKEIPDAAERERMYKEIFGPLKVPKATVAQVADHIDHIRKVAGVDHVGLGADFDGMR